MVHRYMLMPHGVLQHMDADGALGEYERYRKLTFDRQGVVHGV